MNNLQQQLLKAKWHRCNHCIQISGKNRNYCIKCHLSKCCKCNGTGIQPQIFDNEWIDFRIGYWKYKSGDVIKIPITQERELLGLGLRELHTIQSFKVLRTLQNNSKIEVVKL